MRPTQGRTLAVMQVCGGNQSFNAVNTLRILGRWMRMLTIPNQSSVPKAWEQFHEDGRMKDSPYRDRVVGCSPASPKRVEESSTAPTAHAMAARAASAPLPARGESVLLPETRHEESRTWR